MERAGDWIQTATGKAFWPMDPRADEIDPEDIAHALSMLCRFGGHSLRFYSVAEHSVLVSRHVPPHDRLWALLHDATEAYIVDVPRPVKRFMPEYDAIERGIQRAVCERFQLAPRMPDTVKSADYAILSDEAAQVMVRPPQPWSTTTTPLGVTLECWPPERAKIEFLTALETYTVIS